MNLNLNEFFIFLFWFKPFLFFLFPSLFFWPSQVSPFLFSFLHAQPNRRPSSFLGRPLSPSPLPTPAARWDLPVGLVPHLTLGSDSSPSPAVARLPTRLGPHAESLNRPSISSRDPLPLDSHRPAPPPLPTQNPSPRRRISSSSDHRRPAVQPPLLDDKPPPELLYAVSDLPALFSLSFLLPSVSVWSPERRRATSPPHAPTASPTRCLDPAIAFPIAPSPFLAFPRAKPPSERRFRSTSASSAAARHSYQIRRPPTPPPQPAPLAANAAA
jgi:hypothetical protein